MYIKTKWHKVWRINRHIIQNITMTDRVFVQSLLIIRNYEKALVSLCKPQYINKHYLENDCLYVHCTLKLNKRELDTWFCKNSPSLCTREYIIFVQKRNPHRAFIVTFWRSVVNTAGLPDRWYRIPHPSIIWRALLSFSRVDKILV